MIRKNSHHLPGDHPASFLIGRLLKSYARPYLKVLIAGFFCLIILSGASVAPARLIEDVVNEIFIARNSTMLLPVTAMVFAAFLIKGIANYGSTVAMEYVGQRIVADIQKDLFNSLVRQDLGFFHNTPTGELISRFGNDVSKLQNAVTSTMSSLGKDILTLAFFVALMFYQDSMLAMVSFFILPGAILPVIRIGKRMRKASGNIQSHTAELTILVGQIFQGMRVIKSYCMERYEQTRVHNLIETIFKRTYKAIRMRAATHPLMEFLGGVSIAVVILYGGSRVIAGYQTSGAFFSFIAALMLAYEPLKRLANLNANLQEQLAAASRVFAILDHPALIVDRPGMIAPESLRGEIRFCDVSFVYPQAIHPVLDCVSLHIPKGAKVALVGSSGAGKSTLLNLIPRFHDVSGGSVQVDGYDVRDLTLQALRSQIALVSQEIMLFDDTIRANIAYGRADADFSEIEDAARAAAAHDFIINLEKGYETIVGEHGIKLSGGQRQRIAIARAMLKNAPVLLLDEPTSALDSESEQKIQSALDVLMAGRTTLVIAHRLATVRNADIIFVMERGKVIASGTHASLMENCPRYIQLSKAQLHEDQKKE